MLTADRAHQVLRLDVETGILRWRVTLGSRATAGDVAGYLHMASGYWILSIDGRRYKAHLVIWLMLYGEWCPRLVDHEDRNRSNNKPSNLRKATESQQRQNQAINSRNTSGYRGVSKHPLVDKWQAEVSLHGRRYYLGLFSTKEEAAEVARAKRTELFGSHAPSYDLGG